MLSSRRRSNHRRLLLVVCTTLGSGLVASHAAYAADVAKPSAPTNLQATSVQVNKVDLTWNAATDDVRVAKYIVRRTAGNVSTDIGEVAVPATGTVPTTYSYSDTTVAPSTATTTTRYQYKVRAVDTAGKTGVASNAINVRIPVGDTGPPPDTTAPSAPGALMRTAITPTTIVFEWAASTDNVRVAKYIVRRENTATRVAMDIGEVIVPATGPVPASYSFSDTGLTPNTRYLYKVRAVDTAGNVGVAGPGLKSTTPAS